MNVPYFRRIPMRRVHVGRTLAGFVAACLAVLFAVTPAQAADGQITGLAGKCVDVAGANSANGTAVQLYDCNGTNAQRWSNPGDGTLRALGKCLDVVDRSTADGAAVQLWDCSGGANQQWVVTAAHDIVNPAANKCLDVRDNSSANGTRLQIWSCTGGANQKWNAPASGGGGTTPSGFVVSEAQFNQMFPNRNPFYTYSGLTAALGAYPAFANTGSDTVKKQEAAAFLANVSHELLELQLQGRRRRAVRARHDDPARRHGQRRRFRPDHPLDQRLPGVRRQEPRPGTEPRRRLPEVHPDPRRQPGRQPVLLTDPQHAPGVRAGTGRDPRARGFLVVPTGSGRPSGPQALSPATSQSKTP